ncbi:aryl-alcohol oxidase-like protein [Irpex rosettiformis]|uniref:Aryl-alcohol oxidase-like protein n=1 Tax=Irpex rosettiformis TaxID=378272 RepID=A0ACB8TU65_9APHY|nr:aryl-alcohol oxidase-like protein [Irpex rosettiformis]
MFNTIAVLCASAYYLSARAALFQGPSHLSANKAYDYIIVGGGAAGSVLANRLTENRDVHVLLVEAGSSNFEDILIEVPNFAGRLAGTQFDWNFTTTPQPGLEGRVLPFERGHVLGGSTCINFMAFTRGSRDDWDRLANVTNDKGWSWESIFPYAKKLEHLVPPIDRRDISDEVDIRVHGLHGPVHASVPAFLVSTDDRVISTTQQLPDEFPFNRDMNSGDPIGIGWTPSTIAGGVRQSGALSYLKPILSIRQNLDVVVNTHVTKLLQTGSVGKLPEMRGVQLSQPGSKKTLTLRATKEVIVSAGAVKTPQLLMLSGIGDSAELSKLNIKTIVDLPDVGKNLQDHPFVTGSFTVNNTNTLDVLNNATVESQQLAIWKKNHGGLLALPSGNQVGWIRLPKNSSVFSESGVGTDPSAGPTSAHWETILFDGFIGFGGPPPSTGNFFTAFIVLTSPTSRGNVTLNTTDPFAPPIINPSYLTTPFDILTMRSAIRGIRRFTSAPAWDGWITGEFGPFKQAQSDEQLDAFARANTVTINHVSGTVRVGKSGSVVEEGTGALDSDLKVKGTVGLRVVDASIFPFIPAAHTQVPTYIVAERVSDLIKADAANACKKEAASS